jgi:hypothetical protein
MFVGKGKNRKQKRLCKKTKIIHTPSLEWIFVSMRYAWRHTVELRSPRIKELIPLLRESLGKKMSNQFGSPRPQDKHKDCTNTQVCGPSIALGSPMSSAQWNLWHCNKLPLSPFRFHKYRNLHFTNSPS